MLQAYSQVRPRHLKPVAFAERPTAAAPAQDARARITVRQGATVFEEGAPAAYFYKIERGSVRLVKLLADGHRQICDFLLPGDLLGFSNRAEYDLSAEAIQDCVLVRYRRRDADRLVKSDPTFACELQTLMARGLTGAYAHMVRLCHRSAVDRVSYFLLGMAERGTGEWIDLPMSRLDVADYLGLAHETVSRAFTQLKKAGAIVEPTLNRIRIVDRAALEDGLMAA